MEKPSGGFCFASFAVKLGNNCNRNRCRMALATAETVCFLPFPRIQAFWA
jgi:hypothetical protein